ncbi:MAG: kynurenine 3-monooxygenase [Gemmatales bacterium]|nr:MAG: kynurenine 3-monooxygenase [Gemmatales bacterium]
MSIASGETGIPTSFTIVGAGLAGALLACYLGKANRRVEVFEKRADPRRGQRDRGRSINLAISERGRAALREIGLEAEVLRSAIAMPGRMIHDRAGRLSFQPYGKDPAQSIYSVSRNALNIALLNAAEQHDTVRLNFDKRCTAADPDSGWIELTDEQSGATTSLMAACLIAADGAFSVVRSQMQKRDRYDFQQQYLSHGYKELTIPARPDGSHALVKNALHIWPRRSFMMIALPNLDGTFTCTLFCPFEGPNSFAELTTPEAVSYFFEREFPDAVPLLPALTKEFFDNPTGSLVTIRCRPWHIAGKTVLVGDAAHAVVPFFGQGMNAAFEDCSVLMTCLEESGWNPAVAFARYEAQRKPNVDVLADLCIDNFVEMRDYVGSRAFLWKKKSEILLSKLFPQWYVPLYTMVSFTRIPYAEARRRALRQDRIVRGMLFLVAVFICLALGWIGFSCCYTQ